MLLPYWQMLWSQVNYFILSSEVFNRTSPQICGRWYLPMFLLRGGLLTLIYRASLMVLMRFWSSLPTMLKNFLNWFCDQWCYNGQIWGMGPFDVPWTSLQMFWRIPLYILHHTSPYHIYICRWLHFSSIGDLCPLEPPGGFWWYYLL